MRAPRTETRRVTRLAIVAAAALLAAPASTRDLVVIARLDAIPASPACGGLHFGAVAIYSDVTVLEGTYRAPTLRVVHGCPELPRAEYAAGSGDLDTFRPGDYHRLVLTKDDVYGIGTLVRVERRHRGSLFYCRTVSRAVKP